ncbi:hypothetical protein CUMW_257100 [Citrus unshiu]|uniref:Transmembrane protein n=1 Tax=Citrus unshiu TaxID=55188 RepID=A0A2H5QSF1_CITUN|nr:hypothetical protein CUMW_257100 [Citrus unshiu]
MQRGFTDQEDQEGRNCWKVCFFLHVWLGDLGIISIILFQVLIMVPVLRRWRSVNTVSTSVNSMGRKYAVKRKVVGIWGCKDSGKVESWRISSAVTVKNIIWRLKEQIES